MNEYEFTWPGRLPNDPAHDLIVAYLTIDIQHSPKWTDELLQQIKAIKSGKISSWERTGNAYCLRIYPDHVEIEDDYTEEDGKLLNISFEDFEMAVMAWQAYINHN